MEGFKYKSVAILGRQSAIGMAELESLYGADSVRRLDTAALLEIPAEEVNFKRLGGTIKVARVLSVLPTTYWKELLAYLVENVPKHLEHAEPGKFTLGLSVYGLKLDVAELNRSVLQLKKIVKTTGRPIRIVPNKALELNSAQVLHNKLTHRGAWELVFVRDGQQTILAQTLFVQDIEAYAARDQARPKRDARVGMLPPKLAQMLINLAAPKSGTILDPFCGTGVILQEALLMGYNVYGTDLEPRMIEYSQTNLDWLELKYPKIKELSVTLEVADSTKYRWQHQFGTIASEVFLGRPLNSLPKPDQLKEIINDANTITKKFLVNLARQIPPGTRLALAVPAWVKGRQSSYLDGVQGAGGQRTEPYIQYGEGAAQPATPQFAKSDSGAAGFAGRQAVAIRTLPLLANLTDMGYNYLDFKHVRREELVYFREGQTVARQLIVLEKK